MFRGSGLKWRRKSISRPCPPHPCIKPKQLTRLDRAAKLLIAATAEALEQAKPNSPLPVVLGTTSGGMSMGEAFYRHAIRYPGSSWKQAMRVTQYLAQRQALNVCELFQISGPITIIANACATGANAIGHGCDLIRTGRAARVLAGGYDGLSELVFAGFDSLQALSPTTCRPFDRDRDGLALGEGAAILVLESFESARERKAQIIGEIAGYGAATDSHHLTQPHPDGIAAFSSMSHACMEAGIHPHQVGYVNAHGTGTPLNDSSEAAAINSWAGEAVRTIHVSSTKAGIGHLLGAAGAVEAVVCLMALREEWFPPSVSTKTPDPLCHFPLVLKPARIRFEYALSNSFGFGGANASLVFRRWE